MALWAAPDYVRDVHLGHASSAAGEQRLLKGPWPLDSEENKFPSFTFPLLSLQKSVPIRWQIETNMEQKTEPRFATRNMFPMRQQHVPDNWIQTDWKDFLWSQHASTSINLAVDLSWNALTASVYLHVKISHTMIQLSISITSSRKSSLTTHSSNQCPFIIHPQHRWHTPLLSLGKWHWNCFSLLCGQVLYFINFLTPSFSTVLV